LLPNEIFKECHTLEDFGTNRVAWGNDPVQVRRAQATVLFGREDYFKVIASFWTQLERFIHETQARHARVR
jgi:hypothetical protein